VTDTLDEQLVLHDAAALCSVAMLRPAGIEPGQVMAIFGLDLDREALLTALEPALQTAWPDRPSAPEGDLEQFLREAYARIVARSDDVSRDEGFVPAARWRDGARDIFLEHVQLDVMALVGGVRAEGLWFAFGETHDTAPLHELIVAGMMIKARAVGAFLVGPAARHADELTAVQFFPAGQWVAARDEKVANQVISLLPLVHKQTAHLTMSRPVPSEIAVYRPGTYRHIVELLLTLLEQFVKSVDGRLLHDEFRVWAEGLREELEPPNWP
jgi:hypothetical protein